VAERIAEELGVEIGQEVGFQVRFTGEVSRSTKVKLMTDGILLAEIQRDKLLRKYNAIIIDEAHERSLNIDFILGYLKRILPQRPDLKIIITSATIDPERFAKHFGTEEEPSPIIEVSGRTFPVEIRYRPLSQPAGGVPGSGDDDEAVAASDDELEEDRDPLDAVCDAVDELALEAPGDILIFFSGEREIRDAAEALNARIQSNRRLAGTEVLPLFARLSLQEQTRFSTPAANDGSCWPPTSLRRPSPCPASSTLWTPARRASRVTPTGPKCSGCRSNVCPRLRPTSVPAAAAACPTASPSGSTRKTTSSPGRSSPTRRSCAPTSRQSSCR
jgi:ATP-dependent helicase HrpA